MTRLRIPKITPKPKDYSKFPWTEEFRVRRPTQNVKKYLENFDINDDLRDFLFVEKHVDFYKANLLVDTLKNENAVVRNDNEIILTVNFPFCEWRCVDCKRSMYQKSRCSDVYMYYFDALMSELKLVREIISKKCYVVKSVCFTGNILALDLPELEKVLQICAYALCESCIELGNPNFVNSKKLEILKKYNVTRIIVNALTFNTVSLRKLCRRYEFKDIYDSYKLIAKFGFDLTIALCVGLLEEKEIQLSRNLKLAIELGASCIDLYSRHCPYCENCSDVIKNQNDINTQRRLLEFANNFMVENGFEPYFLYCTEVENGCFENVGYALPGKICRFTEDIKQGISTIIGCGSDTKTMIVKNLHHTKSFLNNTYDMGQYVLGIEQILENKRKFFK